MARTTSANYSSPGYQYATVDGDQFDRTDVAGLGQSVDTHDHTSGKGLPVPAAGLASNSVTTVKITDANVTTAKLADGSVTTVKIADANVTQAKMASSSVGTAQLVDLNVTTVKIADANVTQAKLATASVGTAQLVDGSVTSAKLASSLAVTGAVSVGGDLTLPVSGRILGDFSNNTDTSRTLFRTSTVNGSTIVGAYPNGTGVLAGFRAYWGSDPNNASYLDFFASQSGVVVNSGKTGSASALGLTFAMDSVARWRLDTTGHWFAQFDALYDIGAVGNNRPRNVFVSGALATGTKAGVPVDADVNSPTDGMLRVDSSNNRLYCRVGGQWRYAALT